jgi:hypothetical protein
MNVTDMSRDQMTLAGRRDYFNNTAEVTVENTQDMEEKLF